MARERPNRSYFVAQFPYVSRARTARLLSASRTDTRAHCSACSATSLPGGTADAPPRRRHRRPGPTDDRPAEAIAPGSSAPSPKGTRRRRHCLRNRRTPAPLRRGAHERRHARRRQVARRHPRVSSPTLTRRPAVPSSEPWLQSGYGSHAGSHRRPAQSDSGPPGAFDIP